MIRVTVALFGSPDEATADFICDGVNDEVEINAAIAAASALAAATGDSATVYLGPGVFSIAGPVVSTFNNVFIEGSGADTTTLQADVGYFSALNEFGAQYTGLVNFSAVDSFGLSGVTVDAATNDILTNGIVMMPDGSGGTAGSGVPCTNGIIADNSVFLVQGHCYAIWSFRGEHIEIGGNLVDGGAGLESSDFQEGIEVYGGFDVAITANTIRNIGGAAINIGGISIGSSDFSVENVDISNNTIEASRIGVHIGGYSIGDVPVNIRNISVVDNDLSGISQYGIWLYTGNADASSISDFSDILIGGNSVFTTLSFDSSLSVSTGFYFLNTTTAGQTRFSNIEISENVFSHEAVSNVIHPFTVPFLNSSQLLFIDADNFVVARNEIISQEDSRAGIEGIRVHNSRNFSIIDNHIDGADSYAAYVQGSENFVITGNDFDNWNRGGNDIAGLILDTVSNVRLTDNSFSPAVFSGGSVVAWRGEAIDSINNELIANGDARLVDGIIDVLRLSGTGVTAIGGSRDDSLFGNALANIIDGGAGIDAMYGGIGDDSYYVDNALDLVTEAATEGVDRIYTSVSYGLAENSEVETLSTTDVGGTAAIDLTGNSGANTIEGNAHANSLAGGAGDDEIFGHAGNDLVDGGTGVDATYGGVGDDSYFVDDALDRVIEARGEGTDRIYASASYVLAEDSEVERLSTTDVFGTTALYLTGNGGANVIDGNASANSLAGGAGDDKIFGHAGNDLIDGGAGIDVMHGGVGSDNYYIDDGLDLVIEAVNEGTDRIYASTSYVLAEGSEIEILSTTDVFGTVAVNLTGNSGANTIGGNAYANSLAGGAGNDVLFGHGGNDLIDGGTGFDTMLGGVGNDSYFVDDTLDLVIEAASEGADRIYASTSYVLADGSEIETLSTTDVFGTAAINLTGNSGSNIVGGNAHGNSLAGGAGDDVLFGHGGNDLIDGGVGIDAMHGGVGSDNYYVDDALDLVFEAAAEGTDRIYASVTYGLADGSEVETLSTTDVFGIVAINLTGNSGANTIGGNRGANLIAGGGGNDILWGNGGRDTFVFDTALGADNIDYLKDFSMADDRIVLDARIFSGLGDGPLDASMFSRGGGAGPENKLILFDQTAGSISYDPDGAGLAAPIIFAYVPIGTELSHEQFIVI